MGFNAFKCLYKIKVVVLFMKVLWEKVENIHVTYVSMHSYKNFIQNIQYTELVHYRFSLPCECKTIMQIVKLYVFMFDVFCCSLSSSSCSHGVLQSSMLLAHSCDKPAAFHAISRLIVFRPCMVLISTRISGKSWIEKETALCGCFREDHISFFKQRILFKAGRRTTDVTFHYLQCYS